VLGLLGILRIAPDDGQSKVRVEEAVRLGDL
jgi:hypothetical protein